MRPFRKNSLRGKIVDFFSQVIIVAISCLFCLWMISGAKAADTNELLYLRENSIATGLKLEIVFQKKVEKKNVKSEFDRDFLQFSIADASIFPAKNSSLKNNKITKYFAYQYQPDLARLRLYLDSKNFYDIKKNINWSVDKNKVIVFINDGELKKSQIVADKVAVQVSGNEKNKKTEISLSTEEENLLKEMQDNFDVNKKTLAKNQVVSEAKKTEKVAAIEEEPLFSGMKKEANKQSESIGNKKTDGLNYSKVMYSLLIVLAILFAISYSLKKFVLKNGVSIKNGGKIIQTITSYNLAPGKSIAIVKVSDQYLLLGLAGNSITLLKELDEFVEDKNLDKGMSKKSKNIFQTVFESKIGFDNDTQESANNKEAIIQSSTFRDTIKDRIKGYKQLS